MYSLFLIQVWLHIHRHTHTYKHVYLLFSRHETAVGVHRRGGGTSHYTLTRKLLFAYRPERNTSTLKNTCSKCLWNRNAASKSTVRMRDYHPSVPSTYCSRYLVAWQQYINTYPQTYRHTCCCICSVWGEISGTGCFKLIPGTSDSYRA